MTSRKVFHITHVRNLPSIIEHGLLSDNRVDALSPNAETSAYTCIGDRDIKGSRKTKVCGWTENGPAVVADYVPFYFGPRSPMLYTIHQGRVRGYREGQEPVLHLVCALDSLRNDSTCCGTNHNAACGLAEFFDERQALEDAVDWPLMKEMSWKKTQEDPHKMQRRMAEFLVLNHVPFKYVLGIGVLSEECREYTQGLLTRSGRTTKVSIKPTWYY